MLIYYLQQARKYRGRQADPERHKKVLYYRHIKKLSIRETADATGYSPSQICRIQALYKKEGNTDTPSCDDYLPTSLYLKDET